LTNEEQFRDLAINEDEFQGMIDEYEGRDCDTKKENDTTNPKLHTFPKGLFNLENLFDL